MKILRRRIYRIIFICFCQSSRKTADIRTNTDHIGCFISAKYRIDRSGLSKYDDIYIVWNTRAIMRVLLCGKHVK